MSKIAVAALAATFCLCARAASAAVVLDQSDVPETGVAFTSAEAATNIAAYPIGESFTVGVKGVLDHIDIGVFSLVRLSTPLTLALRDDAGAQLFSQVVNGSAVPLLRFGQTRWESMLSFDVAPAKVRVTPGEVLKWSVIAPGVSPVAGVAYQANNVFFSYAGGSAFAFSSLDGVAGRPIAGSDFAFRTYVDTAAAPEPAAWGLMLLGFGLGGAALRSRRAAIAA
jgi:hypothetical protein